MIHIKDFVELMTDQRLKFMFWERGKWKLGQTLYGLVTRNKKSGKTTDNVIFTNRPY